MTAGARVVAKPDAVVLDLVASIRLLDLLDLDNLAVGLLDLFELREEVPVSRLGDHMVWRKDGHPVKGRVGDLRRRQVTADDAVLAEL